MSAGGRGNSSPIPLRRKLLDDLAKFPDLGPSQWDVASQCSTEPTLATCGEVLGERVQRHPAGPTEGVQRPDLVGSRLDFLRLCHAHLLPPELLP